MGKYADSFGVKLYYGVYDPSKPYDEQADPATLIAGIDDFPTGSGTSVEKYSFVRQDDASKEETNIPKAKRFRELNLTIGFDAAEAEAIDALVGELKFFKVLLPTGDSLVGPAYISEFDFDHAKAGEVLNPIKIQPHKRFTFNPAPPAP